MLVLSRMVDQKIIIGNREIEIMVTDIGPTKVQIGIQAPPGVEVHREEVFERIKKREPSRFKPPIPADAATDVEVD